jgi:multidrug efflux system outer membrane protein
MQPIVLRRPQSPRQSIGPMRQAQLLLAAGSLVFLVVSEASAQTARPTPATPPAPTATPTTPAGSSVPQAAPPLPSGAQGATSSAGLPAPLTTNDPMLEPIAPAPHIVTSWQEALGMLQSRSTDLRIALDEIERAEGQWRVTLAASLPTITAQGNLTGNPLGTNCFGDTCLSARDFWTYGANIQLTQPLFAPRAWYALGTARASREARALSAEDLKRVLALTLANAVVSVVTSERLSEINRIGLRAALERLTLARRRVTLGAGNALDTVRADQDVSVARAAVVSGDETLRRARETLGLALGIPDAWGVPADINLNGIEASARSTCQVASAIDERADIQAARTSVEVAKRNVHDVSLQFSPTVNLVSNAYTQTSAFGGKFEYWTIAGVLTIPLWEGGARYGALRDTRAQADQSEQRLEASRRTATIQVTQARRSVEVADESRRVSERARDLAKETERLSRVSFQAGTGTSLDLIESGRRLREAEVQLALQEFNLIQARIAALLSLSRCNW